MKRILLSIVMLAASSLTLSAARSAQNDGKNVSVTGTEVVRTDNNTVGVSFQVHLGGEVTASNRSLIIRPVLMGVGGQSELPPIIVRGARSKAAAETSAMSALGMDASGHYLTQNGTTVDYWTSIPWQDWMTGSELVFSGLNTGKGNATEVNIGTVADNLLTEPYTGQVFIAQTPAVQTPAVTAAPVVVQTPAAPVVQQDPVAYVPPVQAPDVYTPGFPVQGYVQPNPVQTAPVQAPVVYQGTVNYAPPVQQQPSSVWSAPQNQQIVVQRPLNPYGSQDEGVVVQREMPSYASTRDYSPVKGYYDIPERQHPIGTIGDELAARFAFVEPVARFNRAREASSMDAVFDYNMPLVFGTGTAQEDSDVGRFVDMTREGAVYFKFERGSSVMDRDLGENNTMYVDLVSAIRVLDANPDTRIAQIIVVGFSAPEGVLDEKETIAMERAGVARDFLTANTRVDPNKISIYNGSVDWVTLRALVSESNMPEKYKVLEIIDNVPAWNTSRKQSRLGRLMDLNDGDVFAYMRQNFFPQLRQTGAYVKVYYENEK